MYLVLSLIFMVSCGSMKTNKKIDAYSWSYQLQKVSSKTINEYRSVDLVVTDYSLDGSEEKRLNPLKLNKLFNPIRHKISYFSIGEAENYRYYYETMPKDLIVRENPNWKGNFVVKYWDQRWKDILIYKENSYLKQIIRAGFDGVYLDIVDGFNNFPDKKEKAMAMAKLIKEIKTFGVQEKKDFKVIIQNGLNILEYLEDPNSFLSFIDGVGIEDLFFLGNKDHDNPYHPQTWWYPFMKQFQKANIPMFCVEYLKDPKKISKFFKEAQKFGCIPLVTDRSLSGKYFYLNKSQK